MLTDRDERVSDLLRAALGEMGERLGSFEERLGRYDKHIGELVRQDPRAGRLMTEPGVGPQIATALIASICDARQF